MNRTLKKIIACQVIFDELPSYLTQKIPCSVFEYGLHVYPEKLKRWLQEEINKTKGQDGLIFLAMGLCAKSVIGLNSQKNWLVVPNFHDCIGIFLGSNDRRKQEANAQPGTYYLTRGWIEAKDEPFGGVEKLAARYGQEKAAELIKSLLKNYTRLLFIRTGENKLKFYREYSKKIAAKYGLRYEEKPGSMKVIEKVIKENWDQDFVKIPPGQEVALNHFL